MFVRFAVITSSPFKSALFKLMIAASRTGGPPPTLICTAASRPIDDHLMRVIFDAPRLEQLRQIGRLVREHGGLRIVGVGTRVISLRVGIDKHEQVPPTQDELIDGVLSVIGQALGQMNHDHGAHIRIDCLDRCGIEVAHVEKLFELRHDLPRVAHRARRRIEATLHLQTRH